MNCIRDAYRLADDHGDHSSILRDDYSRSSSLSDNGLRDWLDDRLHRDDITYTAIVNGVAVFRVLRPLYEESKDAATDTEQ